jgi:molecular chaperone GrpE
MPVSQAGKSLTWEIKNMSNDELETANETVSVDEAPNEALAAAQAKIAELADQLLRVQAETQNIRRRSEKDVEKAHKFAVERFAADLLPVVDSLERGLEASHGEEAIKAIREGVALTLKMFSDTLKRHSLEQLNPLGEPFNPQLHEAITMLENPDAEPNSVIAVVQKGYTLNGRLVRPAMVVVAKPKTVAAKIDENI